MLGSPNETPYDLRFRLLDIPIRVHPLFWLVMLLISGQSDDLAAAAVFILCAFLSVLVHEMGHGLSSRAMGNEPVGIVLYAMGGVCQFMPRQQTPLQRLFILLLGPGAGFLLLIVVLAVANSVYGVHPADAMSLIGLPIGDPAHAYLGLGLLQHSLIGYAIVYLLEINFWWGILNLLPIWPLDGGQRPGVILGVLNPRHASRWTHIVGLMTAGLVTVVWATFHQIMMAVWFGLFAVVNYQMLQTLHDAYKFSDNADWWQR